MMLRPKSPRKAPPFRRAKPALEELEPRWSPALLNPPTFSWNPIPGALYYDVWVSDLTTGTSPLVRNTAITTTSWTVFRPLTTNDTYEWWVRGISGTGVPGPWSVGTVFTVAALPAPTLVSPMATTVPAPVVTFTWNALAGAVSYDVWVNDLSGGLFARNTEITGISWTPLTFVTPGHSYVWWVRGASSGTGYGAWSSPATFTVVGTTGTVTPGPTLAAPTTLAIVGSSVRPTYTWAPLNGAVFYDLEVDDETSGQTNVVRTQVTSLSFTSTRSLTAGDVYIWWVRGANSSGAYGPWSAGSTFVVTALNTTLLVAPSGPVSLGALSLTWTAVSGASVYEVWINDLSTGQSQVERTEVAGTSLTPVFLNVGHSYEWWVRVWTSDGGSSPWSNPLIFTVG
jgi:hypothetical protein